MNDSVELDELAEILANDSMERAEIYADISRRLKHLALLLMIDQALLIRRCTTAREKIDAVTPSLPQAP
jgi:hypothetical protein